MGMNKIMDGIIEEKLLNMHTAFIGKIVSVQGETHCTVQPLDKIKAYGQKAKSQKPITRVPILNHVRHYSLVKQSLSSSNGSISPSSHPSADNVGHLKVEPLKKGDIVLCICAERDISSSVKGISTTPPVGHHQIANAVVVGLLGGW